MKFLIDSRGRTYVPAWSSRVENIHAQHAGTTFRHAGDSGYAACRLSDIFAGFRGAR